MIQLRFLLFLLLFNSCKEKFTSIEEYFNYPVNYAKTKVIHSTNDFSISLPADWKWKEEQFDTEQILLGIDAGKIDTISGFAIAISIQKYRSSENNSELKAEYKTLLRTIDNNKMIPNILESGRTELLNYDSYFFHTKSEDDNSIEMISFIIQSKEKGVFYSLTASCPNKADLKTNMSIMLNCLKSFEYENGNRTE